MDPFVCEACDRANWWSPQGPTPMYLDFEGESKTEEERQAIEDDFQQARRASDKDHRALPPGWNERRVRALIKAQLEMMQRRVNGARERGIVSSDTQRPDQASRQVTHLRIVGPEEAARNAKTIAGEQGHEAQELRELAELRLRQLRLDGPSKDPATVAETASVPGPPPNATAGPVTGSQKALPCNNRITHPHPGAAVATSRARPNIDTNWRSTSPPADDRPRVFDLKQQPRRNETFESAPDNRTPSASMAYLPSRQRYMLPALRPRRNVQKSQQQSSTVELAPIRQPINPPSKDTRGFRPNSLSSPDVDIQLRHATQRCDNK